VTRIQTHILDDAPDPARPQARSALLLAAAGVTHGGYAQALTSFLAQRSGWGQAEIGALRSEQLTEALCYLALTVFTGYFLNYAQTPPDLPSIPAGRE
jgi:hypothetical protein